MRISLDIRCSTSFRYAGIDDFIAKGGNLRRLDADNHADNLRKLLRGDIDVMLMPQSAAFFAVAKQNLGQKVFFSPTPHSRYERGILIINHRRKLQRYIDSVLEKFDDKWSIIITRYK